MSDHRSIPSASAAALRTVFASAPEPVFPSFCATAEWQTSAAAAIIEIRKIIFFGMPSPQKIPASAKSGLVMFLGNCVRQISFTAGQRFRQHGIRFGIEQRHSGSGRPGLQQHIRILHGGGPGKRVAVSVETLGYMHVFAVEVAADLVKPSAAVEAPGVYNQSISVPMGD